MIRGAYYAKQSRTEGSTREGWIFLQEGESRDENYLSKDLNTVRRVANSDTGSTCHNVYWEILKDGHTMGVIIPKGTDTGAVARELRKQFGPQTELWFLGFPRDHEVIPASEIAALQAARA